MGTILCDGAINDSDSVPRQMHSISSNGYVDHIQTADT